MDVNKKNMPTPLEAYKIFGQMGDIIESWFIENENLGILDIAAYNTWLDNYSQMCKVLFWYKHNYDNQEKEDKKIEELKVKKDDGCLEINKLWLQDTIKETIKAVNEENKELRRKIIELEFDNNNLMGYYDFCKKNKDK